MLGWTCKQNASRCKQEGVTTLETPVTLAELRKRHGGMSQRELARRLGVTPGAVALWETGSRVPRLPMVRKIAKLFGLKSSDLIIFGKREEEDHSSSSDATKTA